MIAVGAVLLGLLIGFSRGGTLKGIGELRLRGLWVVFAALLIQMLIFPSPLIGQPPIRVGTQYLHIASYALIVGFLVWNRRVLWPVMPGMVLNLVAIVANGGYMPASVDALYASGRTAVARALSASPDGTLSNVVAMGESTRLDILGDWLYVPPSVPLATSFSLGDVLLLFGIAWVIQAGMAQVRRRRDLRSQDGRHAS